MKSKPITTHKSKDIPVTKEMLFEARNELKHDIFSAHEAVKSNGELISSNREAIEANRHEIISNREAIEANRHEITSNREAIIANRHEIISVRHDIKALDRKMDSRFDKLISEFRRVGLIVENQNSNNIYVLDKLTFMSDRQERINEDVRNEIKDIKHVISLSKK